MKTKFKFRDLKFVSLVINALAKLVEAFSHLLG